MAIYPDDMHQCGANARASYLGPAKAHRNWLFIFTTASVDAFFATYNIWLCRLKAVDSAASDEEVEEQFTMQLEQLIKQCEDELGLIPKMAEWKPWEVPSGHKV